MSSVSLDPHGQIRPLHGAGVLEREVFKQNPHVKIALSGHMHMVDRVDYLGVSYLCGGAISGNWWKGDRFEFKPGYRVLDLADDGTFTSEYVAWGWKEA
jgi:hypothetical protein